MIDSKLKTDTTDAARGIELVNLMTCADLEAPHQFLFLRQAMTTTYKAENYIDSAHFATRILQKNINPSAGGYIEKTVQQARGVPTFLSDTPNEDYLYVNLTNNHQSFFVKAYFQQQSSEELLQP